MWSSLLQVRLPSRFYDHAGKPKSAQSKWRRLSQAEIQSKSHQGKKKGGKQNIKHANRLSSNQPKAPLVQNVKDKFGFLLLNLEQVI
jgi:hypothetical protein